MREQAIAACLLGLAACFSPSPPGGLPCSSDKTCPDGQTCNLITLVCDGTDPNASRWIDDTAADFMAGTDLSQVSIEPAGFVGPAGSFTGAVRIHGVSGARLSAGSPETFDDLAALPRAGEGFSRTLSIDYFQGTPHGVGLDEIDDVTVLVEGEIKLDVGSYRFNLFADDHGFVDIADPGSDTFTRLVADDIVGTTVTKSIATAGWYKIRGAFSDTGGGMEWTFHIDPPGNPATFRSFFPNELRVRTDDLSGIVFDGFEQPYMFDHRGSTLIDDLDQTWGSDPFEIAIGTDSYNTRVSGQFLVDTDGDYSFDIDSVHGHRAWIDGMEVANDFGDVSVETVTQPMHLEPGWHDLTIDVVKDGGGAVVMSSLSFTIASGPVTGAIPTDHLRPIPARAHRFTAGDSNSTVTIADSGTSSRSVSVTTGTLDTVESIDVCIEFTHTDPSLVQVVVDPPVGSNIVLADVGDLSTAPDQFLVDSVPVGDAGGTWALQVIDPTVDTSMGEITMAGVTFVGHGGEPPFASSYHYESAVHDLGDVFELGMMAWRMRQGDPSMATVKLRTCDDAAACAGETYVDVALGAVPAVPARRFAQYSIDIATDGDVPTALDAVSLDYSVR